jgi:hypothetical protein
LSERDITTSSILNDAVDLVRRNASPWGALVVVAALPFRFLPVEFIERLIRLGSEATHYRNALQQTATLAMIAFVLLLVARVVFARSCNLSDTAGERLAWSAPLRAPLASVALYVVLGLALQTLSVLISFTLIAIPVLAIFSGIAVATCEQSGADPSIAGAIKRLGGYTERPAVLLGLMLVLTAAFCIIALNLYFAFTLLLWLAGGVGGFDTARWSTLFSPTSRLFDFLVLAGAMALLEPFWIAISVSFVNRLDARRTGADLRAWFEEIAAEEPLASAGGER